MALESSSRVSELNENWPLGTDQKNQGDDHLRLIKKVLRLGVYDTTQTTVILAGYTGSTGTVYLRPNGYANTTGQVSINSAGLTTIAGNLTAANITSNNAITAGGNITANGGQITLGGSAAMIGPGTAGTIYLRPQGVGSTTNQALIGQDGNFYSPGLISVNNVTAQGGIFVGTNAGVAVLATNFAPGACYLRPNSAGDTVNQAYVNSSGNLVISGPIGQKSTGTTWQNPSDARIKTVVGDYTPGLAAILGLTPRRFTYLGNETPAAPGIDPAFPDNPPSKENQVAPYDTSPHYNLAVARTECVGLVAQEAEQAMPDLVSEHAAWIDGAPVEDFRLLDASNVTWALVNAVRELTARIEALEAV